MITYDLLLYLAFGFRLSLLSSCQSHVGNARDR